MDDSQLNNPSQTPGPIKAMARAEEADSAQNTPLKAISKEDELVSALGITMMEPDTPGLKKPPTAEDYPTESEHVVLPDPHADKVDLSDLRGTKAPSKGKDQSANQKGDPENDELEALAELVPELKSKASKERENHTMTVDVNDTVEVVQNANKRADDGPIEIEREKKKAAQEKPKVRAVQTPNTKTHGNSLAKNDSMHVQESADAEDDYKPAAFAAPKARAAPNVFSDDGPGDASPDDDQNLGGFEDVDSEQALNSDQGLESSQYRGNSKASVDPRGVGETYPNISSAASMSTATQTHEVRMPMYLPTFKPATGCTNASDFIVRCFVARLRSGITVVKHGRSRWCKSRLRILHIHPDGRSLSWKPAVGEPTSSKRPPKLDLSTCEEVRHAWSPDPLNPMFTGTPILRQKCEAANAHKSFALIFPKRTVDITAVTADQCKVLMEGFSALCFRLQVANLAGRGAKKGKDSRPTEDEEVATTTASVTLTNNSTQHSPANVTSRFKRK